MIRILGKNAFCSLTKNYTSIWNDEVAGLAAEG